MSLFYLYKLKKSNTRVEPIFGSTLVILFL
nr:MAG TPA: hypothetical protein [Caudoviricetes sp.]DAU89603.1 MAG TPA: hypothetical protein [Caudoviricetes sp.]